MRNTLAFKPFQSEFFWNVDFNEKSLPIIKTFAANRELTQEFVLLLLANFTQILDSPQKSKNIYQSFMKIIEEIIGNTDEQYLTVRK